MLIGKEYCTTTCDIERIVGRFNSRSQNILLTCIEEVENNQGERHAFNSKMKSLITETKKTYESKGIDDFDARDNNNYLFCTNGLNPMGLTADNRRYLALGVNAKYKRNGQYFVEILNNVRENIEILRGFFVNLGYEQYLEHLKPVTINEINLVDLNTSAVDRFIQDCVPSIFDGTFTLFDGFTIELDIDNNRIPLKELYAIYKMYHREIGETSKVLPLKYFKAKMSRSGHKISRKSWKNKEILCVERKL